MIAQIVKRYGYYVCSNCRMQQHSLQETCWFCGCSFSNYESELIQLWDEEKNYGFNGKD